MHFKRWQEKHGKKKSIMIMTMMMMVTTTTMMMKIPKLVAIATKMIRRMMITYIFTSEKFLA